MDLFSRFTDTIFLKESSELQKQYDALKQLVEYYPDCEELKEDFYIAKKGLEGEDEIAYQLKKSNIGLYVLRDINIQYEDLKAQIDYIVVTPNQCYFIECKNLIGDILVNERGDFIRSFTFNGKQVKRGMYSPIRQVEAQRDVYKKIWNTRLAENGFLNNLKRALSEKNFTNNHRILVVAANRETILNTRYAPNDVKELVIKSDALVKKIEEDLNGTDKSLWDNKNGQEEWAKTFLNINIEPQIDYYEYYKSKYNLSNFMFIKKDESNNKNGTVPITTPAKDSSELRGRLQKLRKTISQEQNIPLYYIFNNEEMEKIIETMPRTLDSLRKVLPEIKVKCHGEKIINEVIK